MHKSEFLILRNSYMPTSHGLYVTRVFHHLISDVFTQAIDAAKLSESIQNNFRLLVRGQPIPEAEQIQLNNELVELIGYLILKHSNIEAYELYMKGVKNCRN